MADILYFARLAESLEIKSEALELSADCKTVDDLVALLRERGEPFASEFNGETRILVAINQGDAILNGEFTPKLAWKVPMTYLVPYLVSTYASVSSILKR